MDWIYGIHAVQTMLKSAPQRVAELHVQSGRQDGRLQKIHNLADQHGITMQLMSVKKLDAKAQGKHQGVMALCRPGETYDEAFLNLHSYLYQTIKAIKNKKDLNS